MERLLEHAASVLSRHPAPALPLKDVEQELARTDPPIRISGDALLRWLGLRTDLFLILDPRNAIVLRRLSGSCDSYRGRPFGDRLASGDRGWIDPTSPSLEELLALRLGPWVVALHDPCAQTHSEAIQTEGFARLRESVVWASRTVDRQSTRAMVRWLRMIEEAHDLMVSTSPAARS